jgi:hypothetical protein
MSASQQGSVLHLHSLLYLQVCSSQTVYRQIKSPEPTKC